jgi:beta-N-acetylhexosaminidase
MKETPAEQRTAEHDQSPAANPPPPVEPVETTDTPDLTAASQPDTLPTPDSPPQSLEHGNGAGHNGYQELAPASAHNGDQAPLPVSAHNGHQQSTAASTHNGHSAPGAPMQVRPPAAAAVPLRPPTRGRQARRRRLYTRREKVIIWALLVVAFVAAMPIGAYLALKITERQQAQAPISQTKGTPGSTPTPATISEQQREALFIDQMIQHMTLDEELGQMIMVEWDEGGSFNHDLQYMLVNQHAGGIILYTFNGNIQNRTQLTTLTAAIQANAKIPLLISIDQEGGNVNRLDPITGPRPSARDIGASNDPNRAYQQGLDDGQTLRQLGFNVNLAPVVDVQTLSDAAFNASSMAGFEYRMYGTTPAAVTAFAGAYLFGLQSQGVIGSLKHWPGLGADTVDPHDALPVLNRSQADLNKIDFAPYRALIGQGEVDMIMSTHELVPAYDKTLPATLSPILINQVLRQQLGYQGVVITDGLYMKAISDHWTLAQAAVLAVQAGNDILLGPYNTQEVQNVLDALHAAVSSGKITKDRIDLSVKRILALKIKYGLITIPTSFNPSNSANTALHS